MLGVITGLLLVARMALAQPEVSASVSPETVEPGETVEFTITVSGAERPVIEPDPPAVDALPVVGRASGQSISFSNGQMTSTTTYRYQLRAREVGRHVIPPVEIRVGDETLSTPPLTVQVVSDGTPPPITPEEDDNGPRTADEPRPEIDAETWVDDPTPWVGQQVTLTLAFYQSARVRLLGNAEYSPPDTSGLIAEPLPERPQRTEISGGERYSVITRETALIAPAPGEYTIGPATVTFVRNYIEGEETIETEPITLDVRPLPAQGRPDGFSGLVGKIRAELTTDMRQLRAGEAGSIRLQVAGTGNLRQFEPPEIPTDDGARIYQSGEERQISPQAVPEGYALGGTVTFEYLVMPERPGDLTVGPLTVHYFNPDTAQYESATTSALEIEVLPGETGAQTGIGAPDGLRPIKRDSLGLRAGRPVTSFWWFWAMQVLPLTALGWALHRRSELARRARDPRYRRFVEAERRARTALSQLSGGPESEMAARADEILRSYIADKTGASASGLTGEDVQRLLREAGVPETLAAEAHTELEVLRASVYGPQGAAGLDATSIRARIADLITRIEAALR